MFTGIVEKTSEVLSVVQRGNLIVELQNPFAGEDLAPGSSFAINGCCLTLLSADDEVLRFEIGQETLSTTSLCRIEPGLRINVERALKNNGRVDGHFVTGHVDTTGQIENITRDGDMIYLGIQVPNRFLPCLIYKGSVAIDGTSLTVNEVERNGFSVALLPYTYEITNLGSLKVGGAVNVEFDMMGKYVIRYLQTHTQAVSQLADEFAATKELLP